MLGLSALATDGICVIPETLSIPYVTMLIIEDGTNKANANSIIDMDFVLAYEALAGGTAFADLGTDLLREQAIFRTMRWLEALEPRFKGYWTYSDQTLLMPRTGMSDLSGRRITSNTIPLGFQQAVAEGSILEAATPGALQVQLGTSGTVKRKRVGARGVASEVEYRDNGASQIYYQTIFGRIRQYFKPVGGTLYKH